MNLEVGAYQEGGKGTLKIIGALDIATMESFFTQIEPLDEEELTSLSIDFSGLEFIDSTGIGVIMELIYLSQEKGFAIRMDGLNEQVRQIFEIVGVFTILESLKKEGV